MHNLEIYNTAARAKQRFKPIEPGKVRMYVCGMTIYDYCHIGHARMMMAFDVVSRWLRASGYQVHYVRNITDIDDKIIRRAVQNGETIGQLTTRFARFMHEDIAALGMLAPDAEPRATAYVPQMLAMIETLESKGLAYQAGDGDVNFAVRRFPGYGKLSGKSLDALRAGARVEADESKRDPLDFVLWKSSRESEPEEVKWASKWGRGRPGWHIECSAMACALLGERFDIHGGGADLQFPHHENEIAQSEGASGGPSVNYWLHNGFVRLDNEKMSKSLGNFFTIRQVLEKYDAEVIRFFILRSHYRSPLNYSDMHLDEARLALGRLYTALSGLDVDAEGDLAAPDWKQLHALQFSDAMDDDFNTPAALAVLFELATEANRTKSQALARQLKRLGGVLGLLARSTRQFMQAATGLERPAPANIGAELARRTAAKRAGDFKLADGIRAELLAAGIVLEDHADGNTGWRRA